MVPGGGRMSRVEAVRAVFQSMDGKRAIQTLPEVMVLDRHHLAEGFPGPAVTAPFVQTVGDSAADVIAASDQGHARGLVEGFEAANDSQELQSRAMDRRLGVLGLEAGGSIHGLQDESPASVGPVFLGAGVQQEVGRLNAHDGMQPVPSRKGRLD